MLITLLFWSLIKFRNAFEQNDSYIQVWEHSSITLKQQIEHYLSSGEASLLQSTQDFIQDDIRPTLNTLPDIIKDPINDQLTQIETSLQSDVRAAGKLSGNSFALIENNERQTLQSLDEITKKIQTFQTKHDLITVAPYLASQANLYMDLAHISNTRNDI